MWKGWADIWKGKGVPGEEREIKMEVLDIGKCEEGEREYKTDVKERVSVKSSGIRIRIRKKLGRGDNEGRRMGYHGREIRM